ncbi:hypothetical protein KM043_004231 [Ampulex compressa]|nr:hypothetical protein KM043_004231 [Ampulex compressa]
MVLVVELEDQSPRTKEFLGGWKNTVTGLVYYNACTQTRISGRSGQGRNDSVTQTVRYADKFTDVHQDEAVQVHFLPDAHDRFLRAGPFPLAPASPRIMDSSFDKSILESTLKIQKFYRAYRARAAHRRVSETHQEQEPWEEPISCRSTDFTILNRASPRTRADFELLYNLLDRWRILETERSSRSLFESSRLALCGLILSKEVELLRTIDSMKTKAKLRCKENRSRRFLDELSKPVVWRDSRGKPITVDTLKVQRAREHRNLYLKLSREDLQVGERIELLYEVKRLCSMHTCRHAADLTYLVDQEVDLLTRDVDPRRLNWLRNRLKLTFLRLAKDSLEGDLGADNRWFEDPNAAVTKLCKTCGRLLPLERFPLGQRLRSSTCERCTYVKARRGPRPVQEPYERMLREVRRCEMGCYTSPAFVIDTEVVRRLVDDIWHGRSGISECDNLDELRLVRFRREVEWSPWNCLLLTTKEASVHSAIDDLHEFYGPVLLHRFRTRNLQAKVYFESMLAITFSSSIPQQKKKKDSAAKPSAACELNIAEPGHEEYHCPKPKSRSKAGIYGPSRAGTRESFAERRNLGVRGSISSQLPSCGEANFRRSFEASATRLTECPQWPTSEIIIGRPTDESSSALELSSTQRIFLYSSSSASVYYGIRSIYRL